MIKNAIFCLLTSLFLTHAHSALPSEPLETVNLWFDEESQKTGLKYKFVCLCTTDQNLQGRGRMIEVIRIDDQGALFFTHQNTQKVNEIALHPYVTMNAWLPETKRQLSLMGKVEQIPRKECVPFWERMPRQMQLMFISSDHQSPIDSTDILKTKLQEISEKYPEKVSMPEEFIGYRLVPEEITFFEIQKADFPIKYFASKKENVWTAQLMQP